MYVIVGAIAGWIAGIIMHLPKQGWVKNIIIGIIGSAVGGLIFRLIGFYAAGFIANVIVAVIGACIFIYIGKKLLH